MALADPPTRTLNSTPAEHLDDHKRLVIEAIDAIHSGNYDTLQHALDDSKSKKRPLIINPVVHTLTAPLVLDGASDIHIFAYGATLQTSGALASLIEFKNCVRCTWSGGWLSIPDGSTVTNALYVYYDTSQSTRNTFRDMTIEGHYGVGVRVGKLSSTAQCDHHLFENIECIGRSDVGQVGIYVGTDVYGNCLNHSFHNLMCSGNENHIIVAATNAYLTGVWFDTAAVDIQCLTTVLTIEHVRSEDSTRFMDDGGGVAAGEAIVVRDLLWNGQSIHADGKWLKHNGAGLLELDNVRVVNSAVRPVIDCQPPAPLVLHVRGLMEGGGAIAAPYAGAFNVNGNTTIRADSYIELDVNGAVAVIT